MRKYSSYFMGRHLYKFLSPGGCVDSSHNLAATLSKHMRGSQSAWRHGIIQHCPTQLIGLSPYNFTAQYSFTSQYSFTAHYSSPHTTAHLTVQLHLTLQPTSQYNFTSHYSSPHSTASPHTTVHLTLQLHCTVQLHLSLQFTSHYSSPLTTAHLTLQLTTQYIYNFTRDFMWDCLSPMGMRTSHQPIHCSLPTSVVGGVHVLQCVGEMHLYNDCGFYLHTSLLGRQAGRRVGRQVSRYSLYPC